ncbi:MAG: ABC-F family ATP-binding cassette domain-containing protein [Sorangiineae bacterium]|nr:ABC-F family ATP-binding cassette domain-containing protein [Polyangiaceae bacterium]MEB2321943.1 ABC-F family ATP-binding cassette domain-containing protein [Sorangiineae bacterium]
MSLLEVADLTFGYNADKLFEGVTLRLEPGERAALVAPNGAGKSTLLRLIAGELPPDRGSVLMSKSASMGYYRQSHELSADGTVMDQLLSGFSDLVKLRRELHDAQLAAASGSERDLERLADLTDRYQHAGADQLERRVETIATRLGFPLESLERPVRSLSGGERGRLGLGVVLATEPEVLLLDEPTNHLDLDTIRWLEGYLSAWRGSVLLVSHDRAFLDNVCTSTMELGHTSFRVYPLAFSAYQAERAADLERERKLAEEQAGFVAKTEDFIRRNIAGQKTKQAQARRKMLEKLERVSRPEDVWQSAERVRFRFVEAPRSGDLVLEATGLGAERGGRTLFHGLELLVRRGDRVGIVGANGSGKTTLLKLLAGQGATSDAGAVRRGTNLCEGYFDQQLGTLDPNKSLVDEIRSVKGDLNVDATRQYLARFRFYGDDPLRQVASLSGGERTRLALAKLLLEPRNLLFLDEPTNHLDIPAAEILEEALAGFEGTVVLVSHDRRFLENVTTRTVAFLASGVDVYEGGYRDFTDMLARQERARDDAARDAAQRERKAKEKQERDAAASNGAERHKARRAAAREVEKKKKRVAELETLIAESEDLVRVMRERLTSAPGGDWERLHNWAKEEQSLSQKLDRMMSEWTTLSDELARASAEPAEAEA